jgi:hypothetical protein
VPGGRRVPGGRSVRQADVGAHSRRTPRGACTAGRPRQQRCTRGESGAPTVADAAWRCEGGRSNGRSVCCTNAGCHVVRCAKGA